MFKYLQLILVIFAITISSAQAKTYIRDYYYIASEADSKITSRTNALDQVKLLLLQEIGTHIRHEINITKDGSGITYATEDIEAITAGLTSVEIIEEDWNGETYYLKAEIDVDTERVLKELEDIKNEKSDEKKKQLESLKENQRKVEIYREEIDKLREKLKQANSTERETIVIKYVETVDEISISGMFEKGYNFDQKGQFEDAVYWYRQAAGKGFSPAQFRLGVMYLTGRGVKKSDEFAIEWTRKAAELGNPSGQNNLGYMYKKGRGIKQSDESALEWFRKSAEQGNPAGQVSLGVMYLTGRGIKQSDESALEWFRKSAEQDNPAGQYYLGRMYSEGRGIQKSENAAMEWYRKACDAGLQPACKK